MCRSRLGAFVDDDDVRVGVFGVDERAEAPEAVRVGERLGPFAAVAFHVAGHVGLELSGEA
jgi:hypothetical protein